MAAALRTVTYRLSATPKHQLPRIAPVLVSFLAESKDAIASEQVKGSESSILVHKLRTQISALLQEKSVHSRWTALVLIKTYLEIGNWDSVENSANWVRSILQLFQRPSPLSIKHLCVLILSRVFLLAQGHQTFVREVVTPSLPTFSNACLEILGSWKAASNFTRQNDLLQSVLSCVGVVIGNHATSFRPFENKLRTILKELVFHDSVYVAERTRQLAVELLVDLHRCAPRGAGSDERKTAIRTYVDETHAVLSILFRSVREEHELDPSSRIELASPDDEPSQANPTAAGLPGWLGTAQGFERGIRLLQLLQAYLNSPSPDAVDLPLGIVNDLLARVLSMKAPRLNEVGSWEKAGKLNAAISTEERNELFTHLPRYHLAATHIAQSIFQLIGTAASSVMSRTAGDLTWLFATKAPSSQLRRAAYEFLVDYLRVCGPTLSKDVISDLGPIMKSCCSDLESALDVPAPEVKGNGASQIEAFTASRQRHVGLKDLDTELYDAAYQLLPLFFSLPSKSLPISLRAEFDKVALLIRHEEALCLSAANPPPQSASILPLARQILGPVERLETLTRPRFPVVSSGSGPSNDDEAEQLPSHIDLQNMGLADHIPSSSYVTAAEEQRPTEEDPDKTMDVSSDQAETLAQPPIDDSSTPEVDERTPRAMKRHLDEGEEQNKRQRLEEPRSAIQEFVPDSSAVESLSVLPEMMRDIATKASVDRIEAKLAPSASTTPQGDVAREPGHEGHDEEISDDDSDFEIPPLTMNPEADYESH